MIPPEPRSEANRSERDLFRALEGIQDHPDWVVIHSLAVGRHRAGLTGEIDFLVLVPGKGIVISKPSRGATSSTRAGAGTSTARPSRPRIRCSSSRARAAACAGSSRMRASCAGTNPSRGCSGSPRSDATSSSTARPETCTVLRVGARLARRPRTSGLAHRESARRAPGVVPAGR